jgi:F-type H+-transporting ATPase subunit b
LTRFPRVPVRRAAALEPDMAEQHLAITEETPASERGAGFPPFQKETFASQLLWLALFFVALYLIAAKLALPRVGAIMAERKGHLDGDLAEAERMKDEADAAAAAYEKALAEARARAQAMANEARHTLNAKAEVERQALEQKLNARLAKAEQTIAATKTAAMANVRAIAEEAAAAIVARLTGVTPAKATVAAAVDAAIKPPG